jgi:hypothetical protein
MGRRNSRAGARPPTEFAYPGKTIPAHGSDFRRETHLFWGEEAPPATGLGGLAGRTLWRTARLGFGLAFR